MTAAALALRDQLLAVLRDAEGFPLSTSQLAEAVNIHIARLPARGTWYVWDQLDAMARAGQVERIKLASYRQVWWRAS